MLHILSSLLWRLSRVIILHIKVKNYMGSDAKFDLLYELRCYSYNL